MSKNKRMIYIWDENVEFYDSLVKDKRASDTINRHLSADREGLVSETDFRKNESAWSKDQNADKAPKLTGVDDPSHPDWHPDPRIRDIRKQLATMDKRDADNLRKSRSGN